MWKTRIALLLAMFMLLFTTGCGVKEETKPKDATEVEKIVIQAPTAPPTAPLFKLVEDGEINGTKVELILYKSVEEATTRIAKEEADFTVLPVNVAAKLYNKEVDISLANVSTWGILYLLTTDKQMETWSDLKGQELYVGAQGSSPDVLTQYLLRKNGLQENDVELVYLNSPEIAQLMINSMAQNAVLPEPQATLVLMNNDQARRARDFYEDWQAFEGEDGKLPQAGMVVRNEFARLHPEAVTAFQNAYKNAIDWTVGHPVEAAPLAGEKMNLPEPVFIQSMEKTRIFFATGAEAKADVQTYLSQLIAFAPDMVGGKLPDENFFLAD